MPDFAQALQPIAGNSKEHNHNASTKILRDLAPQLFHPRIANSNAFISGGQASSSSSSASGNRKRIEARQFTDLSNPNNAWITLARTLNLNPTNKGKEPVKSQAITSVDLRIIEGVDRLLGLPLPPLESVQEEDEEDNNNNNNGEDLQVGLMEGFNATIPSASYRKTARRRKRADISERQLGIQAGINELGLKEKGDRARGLLSAEWQIDSIEGTPKRRTIRTKRRSSFMPGQSSNTSEGMDDEVPEELTKPELEAEITEIGLDKQALSVRRKLVLTDLEELEERTRKLEDVREELGSKLLQLKEEELELDDELEGVKDRLAALDARSSGKAVSGTSSRRRRGPAFLPSEHDDLPPNIAFMTLTPSTSLPNSASSSSSMQFQQHHPYDQQPPSSITSLDFSEPYGTLVASYSEPDKGVRVYDLSTGTQASDLKGHRGIVKSLLVEGNLCVTGGQDGKIVLWDLPTAIEEGMEQERIADGKAAYVGSQSKNHNVLDEQEEDPFFTPPRRKAAKEDLSTGAGGADEDEEEGAADLLTEVGDGFSRSKIRFLEGHSKDVTCLSYEDSSLVSGSSDKTLRLWDLNTGQCVVTMDILWAISNPLPVEVEDMQPAANVPANEPAGNRRHTMTASVPSLSSPGLPGSPARGYDGDYPWSASSSSSYMTPNRKRTSLSGLRRLSSQYGNLSSLASPSTPTAQLSSFSFAQATPPYSDGSWEMYSDFVGGLQLWSYALASGSADGCVRMWDTRTGQNVRSLIGHTGAITSLQFDNYHLMSGSLDKSLRIWDLRTGKTSEIIKYDGPVTDLQFDSRRILVAGGTNSIQVFNRTTLRQTELIVNGHTSPVEKLRFMDKYLATGGRDSTVKIWSLA